MGLRGSARPRCIVWVLTVVYSALLIAAADPSSSQPLSLLETDTVFVSSAILTTSSLPDPTCASMVQDPSLAESLTFKRSPQDVKAGDVVCEKWAYADNTELNHYSCVKMGKKHNINLHKFLTLNPEISRNCSNLRGRTRYCVAGFVEPLRAWDGKCGPLNRNATCSGTGNACCNSETWTCGNDMTDCAPGTCYEGTCPGDKVYTTTGHCGVQHGFRQCAGRQGNCCSKEGRCGTGPDFCGWGKCQMTNCDKTPPRAASSLSGSSADVTPASTKTSATKSKWTPKTLLGNSGDLAPCDKACFQYMLSSHALLECDEGDLWCMCSSREFSSGVRDCATHTCPKQVIRAVGRVNALFCMTVFKVFLATDNLAASPVRGWQTLPACGRDCLGSMLAQNAALGCDSRDPTCLCAEPNFEADLRKCVDSACEADLAPTPIEFGISYCQTVREVQTITASAEALPECGEELYSSLNADATKCFLSLTNQFEAFRCADENDMECFCKDESFDLALRDCAKEMHSEKMASSIMAFFSGGCATARGAAEMYPCYSRGSGRAAYGLREIQVEADS